MPFQMRSWRNEAPRLLGRAALLLLTMLGPAAAQVGPPVRLLPPPPGTGPAIPEGTAETPPPAPAEGESIKTTPLAPVDAAWIGTPGGIAHPLPQTMWQGTPRALVA